MMIIIAFLQFWPTGHEVIKESKKASQKTDIPSKIVKLYADFFGLFICSNLNYCLKKGEFPCVLKHAGVIPACLAASI